MAIAMMVRAVDRRVPEYREACEPREGAALYRGTTMEASRTVDFQDNSK